MVSQLKKIQLELKIGQDITVVLLLTRSVFGGFLDNHDNQRFLNLNPSHTSLKNALAFLMMGDWIPIVYYGTEQGFNGGSDPYNRESLWPSLSTANPLYKFIQTLAKFRRSLGNEWIQDKQVTHMMKNRCSYLEVLPTCHLDAFVYIACAVEVCRPTVTDRGRRSSFSGCIEENASLILKMFPFYTRLVGF